MKKPLKIALISIACIAIVLPFGKHGLGMLRRARLLHYLDNERHIAIPARRGDILDKDGNVLATNEWVYDIHLDCTVLEDDDLWRTSVHRLSPLIAEILPERSATDWWEYLNEGREKGKKYLTITKGVSRALVDSVNRLPLFNLKSGSGGRIIVSRRRRTHPYGGLARRTIGYIKGDGLMVGLEGSFDRRLAGTDGEQVERHGTYKGQWQHLLVGFTAPEDGLDIHTTLDMKLQALADSALRARVTDEEDIKAGCVVLMEVNTGAVRAMVNLSRDDGAEGRPFGERYNYAIGYRYEPGEVIQTMALASVLNDGFIRSLDHAVPTRHGVLPDYPEDMHIRDFERRRHCDSISVLEGFAMSSRYVTAKLVTDYYGKSHRYFVENLRSYCLDENMAFQLEGLRPVDITDPDGSYWKGSTLPSLANGHALVMTPLDILSFYNTVANKGDKMWPYLVNSYGDRPCGGPGVIGPATLKPAVCDTLVRALSEVMNSGTGTRLKNAKYAVAGKTGTAWQIIGTSEKDPYHDKAGRKKTAATFAGFFPADNPQYSVICVIFSDLTHKSYHGGTIPARVVNDIVNQLDLK